MKKPYSWYALAAISLISTLLGGCSTVQPWQKGILSRPEMTFESDPLETRYAEHTYFSKEAASGGGGAGGGGCGCN